MAVVVDLAVIASENVSLTVMIRADIIVLWRVVLRL